MLFPTHGFAFFFLIVFTISWAVFKYPTARKIILIISSYVFYAIWDWRFLILLIFSSVINFAFGRYISLSKEESKKRLRLILGIVFNLLFLGFFKYCDFFILSASNFLNLVGLNVRLSVLNIFIPVGISFYTFQALSYLIDIYREEIESKNVIDVLFYIGFFPQLLSGPIIKAESFFNTIIKQPDRNNIHATRAFGLILSGLIKKMIIANYVGTELVDPIFNNPYNYSSLDMIFAAYGYAVQIYCDFSAYSDMALGFAALLGYLYPRNFNRPYSAYTIQEFWKRWHMSLSSWLMNYIFYPLQFKLRDWKKFGNIAAIVITFFLCGVWHGAGYTFMLWGLWHGVGLAIERFVLKIEKKNFNVWWKKALGIVFTFNFVCIGWLLFKADNFDILWNTFSIIGQCRFTVHYTNLYIYFLLILGLIINFIPEKLPEKIEQLFARIPLVFQGVTFAFLLIIISAMSPDGVAPFIYFKF